MRAVGDGSKNMQRTNVGHARPVFEDPASISGGQSPAKIGESSDYIEAQNII